MLLRKSKEEKVHLWYCSVKNPPVSEPTQLKPGLLKHRLDCMIPLSEVPGRVKFKKTESGMVDARDWGRGKWKILFNGDSVSVAR